MPAGQRDVFGTSWRQVIAKTSNRKRTLTVKLWGVARQLRQSFHETVERSGVTRAQWTLIAAVASRPGATQRVLAELLQIREITVGRLISRLCTEGYLARREHPNDGRAYCVYITPAARPLLDTLDKLAKVHEAALFAGFHEDELGRLSELLDAMEHNLSTARIRCDDKISR